MRLRSKKIAFLLATKVRYHTVTSLATSRLHFGTAFSARATIQPVSAARKPVIVRNLTRDWCAGYAGSNPASEISELELLDSSGKLRRIAWNQVKWVCYVREFPAEGSGAAFANDGAHPERLLRRKFSTRPRIAGLWLSLTLVDGDELEGVAANDRSLIEGSGVLLAPPDTRSNTQRVFVPRGSIRELTVLGVISPTSSARQKSRPQPQLFESDPRELGESEGG